MLTPQDFDQVIKQVEYDREVAHSGELVVLEDQVWTKMVVASRHAILVKRFEALSATERNYAARLSSEPWSGIKAEQARVRAAELLAIAERHKKAAEDIYEEGAKLREEAAGMMERQQQQQGGGDQPISRRRPRTPQQQAEVTPAGAAELARHRVPPPTTPTSGTTP